jgi:hypothetical protein
VTATTPRFGLTYATDSDVPNYPLQGKTLAENVETALGRAGAQSKATLIATEQERASTSYGMLTTPDEVTGIVTSEKTLILVSYHALWLESVAGAGRAQIFVGANPVNVHADSSTGQIAEAAATGLPSGTPKMTWLTTAPYGLVSGRGAGPGITTDSSSPTVMGGAQGVGVPISMELAEGVKEVVDASAGTLAMVGGVTPIYVPAGTYAVGVRFKATSGNVKVKNRRLYVWTQEFA